VDAATSTPTWRNIIGGDHNDVLTGSATSNHIDGLGGNDQINAGLGADVIDAGPGTDTVSIRRPHRPTSACGWTAGQRRAGRRSRQPAPGGERHRRLGQRRPGRDLFRNVPVRGAGQRQHAPVSAKTTCSPEDPARDILDAGRERTPSPTPNQRRAGDASLDGVANDGQSGEGDKRPQRREHHRRIRNDTLTGNAGPNILRGLAGNDQHFGLAGNDTLIGSDGTDTAAGGAGTDTCQAETTTGCP
jgi:Ca2+-binding RTX toxin-like protein